MTKKEKRINELNKHYAALENIAKLCGIETPNGKKMSLQLLKLETTAREMTTNLCNGEGDKQQQEANLKVIKNTVNKMFNNNLKGFYINTDARGKALKINDDEYRKYYINTGLFTDWVMNGLLSPEID